MNDIAKTLIASGTFGLFAALVLYLFLKPAIENWIRRAGDKVTEELKVDHTLISRRYDSAKDGLDALEIIIDNISTEMTALIFPPGKHAFRFLLDEIHPKYRDRYKRLRGRFELSNDALSSYSIAYDDLLHPSHLKDLFLCRDGDLLCKPSDARWVYKKVWLSVLEGMRSVMRVTSSARFWTPSNFGTKSDAWAAADMKRTDYYLTLFAKRNGSCGQIFYLLIERDSAQEAFWKQDPISFAEKIKDKHYVQDQRPDAQQSVPGDA